MDYSQLSDFEINKRVAEVIYKDRDGLFVARNIPSREGVTIVAEINSEDICIAAADYCNNWSDAGPVIESKLICLAADVFAESHDGGKWVAQPAYGWEKERVRSNNPLRAAMIVFLMMQDANHA